MRRCHKATPPPPRDELAEPFSAAAAFLGGGGGGAAAFAAACALLTFRFPVAVLRIGRPFGHDRGRRGRQLLLRRVADDGEVP